jgi:hypothetical protein
MSQKKSIRGIRRGGFGLVTAAGGALAAAAISMGTAHADPTGVVIDTYSPPDPYVVLFGAYDGQGAANASLDTSLADQDLGTGDYAAFYNDVATFESTAADHGLENLIYAIDPSAFYLQSSADIAGTVGNSTDYLVPDSFLGYLSTGLDYGLLTPTGLTDVLTPLIDLLTGTPFS